MISEPSATYTLDSYTFSYAAEDIQVEFGHFHESDGGLFAEVELSTGAYPAPGLLNTGRFNLVNNSARDSFAKQAQARQADGFLAEVDLQAILLQSCRRALARYRQGGDPAVRIVDAEAPRTSWLLHPFIENTGGHVIFGDGGVGKSTIALAMAVTLATGIPVIGQPAAAVPVLYLDWEADIGPHKERLLALLAGTVANPAEVGIWHRRMTGSLVAQQAALRAEVSRTGAGLVIVDSLGLARNGEPESADVTIRLFNAANSLGGPWIGIDHLSKSASGPNGANNKPFGSVYTSNAARMTWRLSASESGQPNERGVQLTNEKRNNGPRSASQVYRIRHETHQEWVDGPNGTGYRESILDCITLEHEREIDRGAERREQPQHVVWEAAKQTRGPFTPYDLSVATNLPIAHVRTYLSRMKQAGLVSNDIPGLERGEWAVLDRTHAEAGSV